jgi:hypothetical protein
MEKPRRDRGCREMLFVAAGGKGFEPSRDLHLHTLTKCCVCQLPPAPHSPCHEGSLALAG